MERGAVSTCRFNQASNKPPECDQQVPPRLAIISLKSTAQVRRMEQLHDDADIEKVASKNYVRSK
jgi:hypothetical protein